MSQRLAADARDLFAAGLAAVDARAAVEETLTLRGAVLRAGDHAYELRRGVRVLGLGKAAVAMARGAQRVLGAWSTAGLCVTREAHPLQGFEVLESGHPVPDARSLQAGRRVVEHVRGTADDELLLVLLSGGASALVEGLPEGVGLEDLQALTELLLRCGAPIEELNAVRRALSCIKGGRLLLEVPSGVRCLVLVISDVLGSPLAVIGSGPFVAEPASAADALAVLSRRQLLHRVPPPVLAALDAAATSDASRARRLRARAGDVRHVVVADNRRMAEAALRRAREKGYQALLLSTFIEGEAREVGAMLAALAREIRASGQPAAAPACVVASGEPTVTVRGDGRGGRCQEAALSFALRAAGLPGVVLLAGASDGSDGPTDAAGAVVDGMTKTRAEADGLDARSCLENNDAYGFFERSGDLLVTGPTGTNTNDLLLLLVGRLTS